MSIFDGKRLTNETFKLDIERMRRGWYSDKYFENINRMLTTLSNENYNYSGQFHNLPAGISPQQIAVGDIEVEMQWFTRRMGKTTVVGVDKSLAMLKHCTGYFDGDKFIDTSNKLEVWAVQDGTIVKYEGDPTKIQPV
ncbi:MAG: nicotinate phosphoribosyltransferase, partial [Anaerolineales bacterium]|nr:nicotinate phosphoribosyltransferase [Anaerolineales bacterium]